MTLSKNFCMVNILKERSFWLRFDYLIFGTVLGCIAYISISAPIVSLKDNILCGILLRLYFYNFQRLNEIKGCTNKHLIIENLVVVVTIIAFSNLEVILVIPMFFIFFYGLKYVYKFDRAIRYPLSYVNRAFFWSSGFLFTLNLEQPGLRILEYVNPLRVITRLFF